MAREGIDAPAAAARPGLRPGRVPALARQPGRPVQHPQRPPAARLGPLDELAARRRHRLPDRGGLRRAHEPRPGQRRGGHLRPGRPHHELRRRLVRRGLRRGHVQPGLRRPRYRHRRRRGLEGPARGVELRPLHPGRHRGPPGRPVRLEEGLVRRRAQVGGGHRLPRLRLRAGQHRRPGQRRLRRHRPSLRERGFRPDAPDRDALRPGLRLQSGQRRRHPGDVAGLRRDPRGLAGSAQAHRGQAVPVYGHVAQPGLRDGAGPGPGRGARERRDGRRRDRPRARRGHPPGAARDELPGLVPRRAEAAGPDAHVRARDRLRGHGLRSHRRAVQDGRGPLGPLCL